MFSSTYICTYIPTVCTCSEVFSAIGTNELQSVSTVKVFVKYKIWFGPDEDLCRNVVPLLFLYLCYMNAH